MRILIFFKVFFLVFFNNTIQVHAIDSKPVRAKNGMVVSASKIASDVGIEILKKGGNAVDAAVATGFALAVTYPSAGNLGGGGYMIIRTSDGKNIALDFRETAPAKSFKNMYLDEKGNFNPELSTKGITSAGVPGSVAGLIYALENYGTMKLNEVIEPAIKLAAQGFSLEYDLAEDFKKYLPELLKFESSKKIFSKNGIPFEEGEIFVQKDLAKTLKFIKEKGKDGFYKGEIAALLIEQSKKSGGYLTFEDLENYKVLEKEPVIGNYKSYKIISKPPSSSGGIALIQSLNILENFNFSKDDWNSSKYIHTLSEILKYVYADRSKYLGDENFVEIPKDKLISKEYAKGISQKIGEFAVPSSKIFSGLDLTFESNETTHYSVADKFGNFVSTTTTINSAYGSKLVVEGAGFLLNNEMDDFSAKPGVPNQFGLIGSEANSIAPGKRMLSSMTPAIILKDEKPFMAIGSPGGSTIITTVLQVILNVLDFGMNIRQAIEQPRFHHQGLPDEILFEKFGLSNDVKENLIEKGHKLSGEFVLGRAEGILLDNDGIFWGMSDPRGFGKAAGF